MRFWELSETPRPKISRRPTGNWPGNGIQTCIAGRKKKRPRKSLNRSMKLMKSSATKRSDPNMTVWAKTGVMVIISLLRLIGGKEVSIIQLEMQAI